MSAAMFPWLPGHKLLVGGFDFGRARVISHGALRNRKEAYRSQSR